MSQEHSPEPWSADIEIDCAHIRDANGRAVTTGDGWYAGDDEPDVQHLVRENYRRIVACLNACMGIPTEWLEGRRAAPRYTGLLDEDEIMCFPRLERLDGHQ